eukprot:TRINITY_DN5470_c0_g1_i1.p2 TRINITY_DN5470_c0_g1~~TRINITY_DN5470_c0_g1_i1.p2  ORF type:complete len:58 (-),score=5.31 TRINITY_DN5470_c0_g1_i1:455-628(-)
MVYITDSAPMKSTNNPNYFDTWKEVSPLHTATITIIMAQLFEALECSHLELPFRRQL